MQTLMSTPIVEFPHDTSTFSSRNIGTGALDLYLVMSLPLMVLTFVAWGGMSWWYGRAERKKAKLSREKKGSV